jgi:hypothetical protein
MVTTVTIDGIINKITESRAVNGNVVFDDNFKNTNVFKQAINEVKTAEADNFPKEFEFEDINNTSVPIYLDDQAEEPKKLEQLNRIGNMTEFVKRRFIKTKKEGETAKYNKDIKEYNVEQSKIKYNKLEREIEIELINKIKKLVVKKLVGGPNSTINQVEQLESDKEYCKFNVVNGRYKDEEERKTVVEYLGKYEKTDIYESEENITPPEEFVDDLSDMDAQHIAHNNIITSREYIKQNHVVAIIEEKYAIFQHGKVLYEKWIKKHKDHDTYENNKKDKILANAQNDRNKTLDLEVYPFNDNDFAAPAGGGKRRTRKANKSKKRSAKKSRKNHRKSAKRKSRKSRR